MQDIFQYMDGNRDRMLEELFTLVRQPSISTQGVGMAESAALLAGMMREIGNRNDRVRDGRPSHRVRRATGPRRERRRLLVYGHYDVQPPDPLEEWKSPPFEPTIRDGRIYGRGTADNKGQLLAHLKATEAYLRTRGRVPINLKFIFDGEEEINSPSLRPLHRAAPGDASGRRGRLPPTDPGHESGRQLVNCGLKGMCYVELTARGANHDLHSMRAAMVPSARLEAGPRPGLAEGQGRPDLHPGLLRLGPQAKRRRDWRRRRRYPTTPRRCGPSWSWTN